jgi:hypothetical protein
MSVCVCEPIPLAQIEWNVNTKLKRVRVYNSWEIYAIISILPFNSVRNGHHFLYGKIPAITSPRLFLKKS